MTLIKAYKVELDPTIEQRKMMERWAGCDRLIYNEFLAEMTKRIEAAKAAKAEKNVETTVPKDKEQKPKLTKEERKAKKELAAKEKLEKQNRPKQKGGRKKGVPIKIDDGSPKINNVIKTLLPELRKKYPFLNDVYSQVLQGAAKNCDEAFKQFWDNVKYGIIPAGYPQYKSKKNTSPSFRSTNLQSVKITNSTVYYPWLGTIKLKQKGYIPTSGKYTQIAFSKRGGKWFVSVGVHQPEPTNLPKKGKIIGVDVGARNIAAIQNKLYGNIEESPRLIKLERDLVRWQKRMNRRYKPGKKNKEQSKNWHEAKKMVGKLYYEIDCIRKDYKNKVTSEIVYKENPEIIILEDLNVAGMMKNKNVASELQKAGIGEVLRQVQYKAKINNTKIIKCHKFFGSSKRCSNCFKYNEKLGSNEIFKCPLCGHKEHRDANAPKTMVKGYKENRKEFHLGEPRRTLPRVEVEQKAVEKSIVTTPIGIDTKLEVILGLAGVIDPLQGSDCPRNQTVAQAAGKALLTINHKGVGNNQLDSVFVKNIPLIHD